MITRFEMSAFFILVSGIVTFAQDGTRSPDDTPWWVLKTEWKETKPTLEYFKTKARLLEEIEHTQTAYNAGGYMQYATNQPVRFRYWHESEGSPATGNEQQNDSSVDFNSTNTNNGQKRLIQPYEQFWSKIPELSFSKDKANASTAAPDKPATSTTASDDPAKKTSTSSDPAILKKNFVMWLEQEKNGKWEAVKDRRFEYDDMTVKDFKEKLETYAKAVTSENNKSIQQNKQNRSSGQSSGGPVHYRVKWDASAAVGKYDSKLCSGTWRPKGETRYRDFFGKPDPHYFGEMLIHGTDDINYGHSGTIYADDFSSRWGIKWVERADGKIEIDQSSQNLPKLVVFRRDKTSPLIVERVEKGKTTRREYVPVNWTE